MLVIDCRVAGERARAIRAVVSTVRRGDLAVIPTETAYAIVTDPFSASGVERLRAAKGRGRDLPLPICVARPRMVDGLVSGLGADARALIDGFWPGPLTLIALEQPTLAWDLGDSHGTVTVRMPIHPVALEVIRETGPLVVTTANRAGATPARTCQEAQETFGDDVAVYLDDGASGDGEPSSVVDVTGVTPILVRAGAFTLDALREACPSLVEAQTS